MLLNILSWISAVLVLVLTVVCYYLVLQLMIGVAELPSKYRTWRATFAKVVGCIIIPALLFIVINSVHTYLVNNVGLFK